MIDYRDLFPPCPPPMYGVSQPLYMRAHQGKIYCKLSAPGDEKPLCMLDPIAADLRRRFAEIGLEIDQPGVSIELNTLHYTVKLTYLDWSSEMPTVLGEIKLPMGYPELIK